MGTAGVKRVEATVSAQNQFTDPISFARRLMGASHGYGQLSVKGVSDSTVTLQRSIDGGATWRDVEQYTADTEKEIHCPTSGVLWRVGVKTGDYGTEETFEVGLYA